MEDKNIIREGSRLIVGGSKISDPKERYDICKSCEKFFKPTRQCRECMCVMSVKTKLHEATCPIGKW